MKELTNGMNPNIINILDFKESIFMTDLKDLFVNVLDDDEKILKAYKPVRKTVRNSFFFFLMVIPLCWPFLILCFPIFYPIYRVSYTKSAYVCTNKRIIVRGGIVGVDYKFLEYKSINATTVHVGIIDKVSKTNTGTIMFGSPSTPLGATDANGIRTNPFVFGCIEDPYEEHKKIKQIISGATSGKAEKTPGI